MAYKSSLSLTLTDFRKQTHRRRERHCSRNASMKWPGLWTICSTIVMVLFCTAVSVLYSMALSTISIINKHSCSLIRVQKRDTMHQQGYFKPLKTFEKQTYQVLRAKVKNWKSAFNIHSLISFGDHSLYMVFVDT